MSLIKCAECGKEISEHAIGCPHCGLMVEDSHKAKSSGCGCVGTVLGFAVLLMGVLFLQDFIWGLGGHPPRPVQHQQPIVPQRVAEDANPIIEQPQPLPVVENEHPKEEEPAKEEEPDSDDPELRIFMIEVRDELERHFKDLMANLKYLQSDDLEDGKKWGGFARSFRSETQVIQRRITDLRPKPSNVDSRFLMSDAEHRLYQVFHQAVFTPDKVNNAIAEYHVAFAALNEKINKLNAVGQGVSSDISSPKTTVGSQESPEHLQVVKRSETRIALTRQLIRDGKAGESQAHWMEAVIEDLPDTELAEEAAELLKQLR